MGIGFAPTWLRQVSLPASHDHFNHWCQPSINSVVAYVRYDCEFSIGWSQKFHQNLMHHNFATVSHRVIWFSPVFVWQHETRSSADADKPAPRV